MDMRKNHAPLTTVVISTLFKRTDYIIYKYRENKVEKK